MIPVAGIDLDLYDSCTSCGMWKRKDSPCTAVGCEPAGFVICPWFDLHDTYHKKRCPACKNTGYVEALDEPGPA